MASVNEGFQNDEIQINESVLNEEDGTKIDYSKAQKKPQITAAIAGMVLINSSFKLRNNMR